MKSTRLDGNHEISRLIASLRSTKMLSNVKEKGFKSHSIAEVKVNASLILLQMMVMKQKTENERRYFDY